MLLALAAIWGASFLFIRVAVEPLHAIVVAEGRVLLGAATLVLWAVAARRLARPRVDRGLLVLAAVNSAAPFTLIALAELEIEASLAAILNAVTPLYAAVIGAVWTEERLTAERAAGLLLGVAGVALVVGLAPFDLDVAFVAAAGASLLAALCYAVGGHLTRRRLETDEPVSLAAAQHLLAAGLLAPLVVVDPPVDAPDAGAVACLVAVGVACTGLAYVIFFRLIAEVGATSALTVTFLVPAFGVLWAALFLGEAIHAGTVLGGLAILAGVALVTGAARARSPAPAARAGRPPT
jgi:drug/metabolite transporter (DMT)-like permease